MDINPTNGKLTLRETFKDMFHATYSSKCCHREEVKGDHKSSLLACGSL